MNLKFGVLWLEDQFVEAERLQIEQAARGHGFEVEVTTRPDGSDLGELAREQERHYPFDLILIDWDLRLNADGVDAAEHARRLFPATPILFYSAKRPLRELREMIFGRGVEGVFVSPRDEFTRRTGELIGNLAASFNRLAGMRGLAARVLAECDDHHRAILAALSEQGHDEQVREVFTEYVEGAASDSRDAFERANQEGMDALLLCRAVTSQTLYKAVRRITRNQELKERVGNDRLAAARRNTANFDSQVIQVRNALGHVLEERTEDGWFIRGAGADGITVERFSEIRRDFLENLAAIKKLRLLLIPEQAN